MKCQHCNSERLLRVMGKCSDRFIAIELKDGKEYQGYVPTNIGIGGNDDVRFTYCLDCGQIQGSFPITQAEVKEVFEDAS